MRHAVLVAVLLLPIGAISASGQSSAFGVATVRATVGFRPITMTVVGETDFGAVANLDVVNGGRTAVINPRSLSAGQNVARYLISGEPNAPVTLGCQSAVWLILSANGSDYIEFHPDVVQAWELSEQPIAPAACAPGATLGSSLSSTGQLNLWLGGRLLAGSPNPPTAGAYVGTYTINVAY